MKCFITAITAIVAAIAAPVANAETENDNPFAAQTIETYKEMNESARRAYVEGVIQTTALIDGIILAESEDIAQCISANSGLVDSVIMDADPEHNRTLVISVAAGLGDICATDKDLARTPLPSAEAEGFKLISTETDPLLRGYVLLGAIDTLTVRMSDAKGIETGQCVRDATMTLLNPKSDDSVWLMEQSTGPVFSTLTQAVLNICSGTDYAA